jgi:hypothetical protein
LPLSEWPFRFCFLFEFNFFAQVFRSDLPRRRIKHLPIFLSVFFVIFVLSAAMEVVMFYQSVKYPSDVKQRQLAISGAEQK